MSASGPYLPPESLIGVRRRALVVGVVGLVACAVGAVLSPTQFFRSYLVGVVLWTGVACGCLALTALQHMTRGAWGVMIRRILEAGARTFPLLLVLFLPVFLGLRDLYNWANPEIVAKSELLQHQSPYLNAPFFIARTVFYFALWTLMATLLTRLSWKQDETGDPSLSRKLQIVSGPSIVLYGLTASFAAIDWLMSLNEKWYSSIYGVYFVGSQALAALAFTIIVVLYLGSRAPMEGVYKPRHLHDYGKLLLAFTMLWAYFSISQFLIIWSGNLPEEITWYQSRMGDWKALSLVIVLFHFVLPFVLLLSASLKKDARKLAAVALLLLVMRWVDLFWQAAPAFNPAHMSLHWLDLATPIGIGGIWVWYFVGQLQRRTLLPVQDPFLAEALRG
ncbi:MAG: hypothetical protein ABIT01_15850 [Thermoanaerobaculia bacterium]